MEKSPPFISVVVPFFNARPSVEQCLDSLLRQSYPLERYEIIMVNNGSTDGGDVLLKKYKNVFVCEEPHKGIAHARNKGVASARGNVIAFIDADCVAAPDWLEKISEIFRESAVAALAGEIKAYQPNTDIELFYEKHLCHQKSLSSEYPYAGTANFSVRKDLLDALGRFDERLPSGEDVDLCWRLQQNGYSIAYRSDLIVYHRNVKTKRHLFRKFFFQHLRAPLIVKKNLKFFEKSSGPPRINTEYHRRLLRALAVFILLKIKRGDTRALELEIIFLSARQLGLLCGSARYGFLFI